MGAATRPWRRLLARAAGPRQRGGRVGRPEAPNASRDPAPHAPTHPRGVPHAPHRAPPALMQHRTHRDSLVLCINVAPACTISGCAACTLWICERRNTKRAALGFARSSVLPSDLPSRRAAATPCGRAQSYVVRRGLGAARSVCNEPPSDTPSAPAPRRVTPALRCPRTWTSAWHVRKLATSRWPRRCLCLSWGLGAACELGT